jgi:hypothetical protein
MRRLLNLIIVMKTFALELLAGSNKGLPAEAKHRLRARSLIACPPTGRCFIDDQIAAWIDEGCPE